MSPPLPEASRLEDALLKQLQRDGLPPTDDQARALNRLARYLATPTQRVVFVLRGSAGTGKTALLRALAQVNRKEKTVLRQMAPTGRAAKVLERRSRKQATTIHRHIYTSTVDANGRVNFRLRDNNDPDGSIYVVDEASMIADLPGSGNHLLRDLISFIFTESAENKLLMVGDPAQLPPVGQEESPGLSGKWLEDRYALQVAVTELRQVQRQAANSGILQWATALRDALENPSLPWPTVPSTPDIEVLSQPGEAVEAYLGHYRPEEEGDVVLVTPTNKMALEANLAIRNQLFFEPDRLQPGDQLLVVKNQYRQSMDDEGPEFIANGDAARVIRAWPETEEERYGLLFLRTEIELMDWPEPLETWAPTDLLYGPQPALTHEQLSTLWQERRAELRELGESTRREDLMKDEFISALQLKFGYALTGHKAQGGQWEAAIVAFHPLQWREDTPAVRHNFLRWTYTAVTRASQKLYLLGCPFSLTREEDTQPERAQTNTQPNTQPNSQADSQTHSQALSGAAAETDPDAP